jgi:hypothetical protein
VQESSSEEKKHLLVGEVSFYILNFWICLQTLHHNCFATTR